MVKVSIIVPVYNVEKYLSRCMESLLSQTLNDIEIILVDDGSPDVCPAMCDEYAKQDSRVKVIHKQNAGLGYARNSGLEIATGEYVAFVDSDDYVDVKMYETLYQHANNHKECDAVFCGFKKQFSNGTYISISETEEPNEFLKENITDLMLDFVASKPFEKSENKYEMSVWHSIYSNRIINKGNIVFFSERIFASEDIPFQIDFLKYSNKILFIPDTLYYYCYNEVSLTKKLDHNKLEKFKNIYNLLNEKLRNIDIDGFRVKRLFISYIRAYIRLIEKSVLTKEEKILFINKIVQDEIWDEFRDSFLIKFLPSYQGIALWLIYKNKPKFLYYYFRLYNLLGK